MTVVELWVGHYSNYVLGCEEWGGRDRMLGQGQMPGGRPWVDGFGDSGGLEALRLHGRHTYRSFFTGALPGVTNNASV